MVKFLLDTTVCIALIRGNKKVLEKIYENGEENCYVSEMTIAELFYGASKSGRSSHFQDVKNIIDAFEVLPIFPCLRTYGGVKSYLESKGLRIDEFDLLIGATALDNSMILVTHNTKHFNRIPNVKIEDWE